jgi:DNA-binding beta-propeller fold protein YncE
MRRFVVFAIFLIFICGCASPPAKRVLTSEPPQVWGEKGARDGEFIEPRAIAVAPSGFAYVVDSSGRIHKWTTQGKFVTAWIAPKIQKGRPEGVAVLPNGNVAITNTHDSKILIYSPGGKLLKQFGTYGRQRGGFLLVTGICVDKDGYIYAADYGGDYDRISKWTQDGKLLATWAGHGDGPRQFRRPCGLAISKNGDLLVADINNHRIQILDKNTGQYKGEFGGRGQQGGQLTYPYGVAVDSKGFIYTVEYGNHRVQKWSSDYKFLAQWGGPGHAPGKLANPWGLTVDKDQNIYVADTQNHRIQKFRF